MSSIFEAIVVPRTRDLGDGFEVRRVLPSAQRRTVGPFVFFDQMGPTVLRPGMGLDVRPHPHIGLATVTYLFEGEILHRDSLGTVQPIRPGEVNWMTAGQGIVHSERTPPELRESGSRLFGIQTWVGLPKGREEVEPAFAYHPEAELPVLEGEGKRVRQIVGELYGSRSPLAVFSDMFMPTQRSMAGLGWNCRPITKSERSILPRAQSRSAAKSSKPGGCSPFVLPLRSQLARLGRLGCCCWAASRWTGRGISGGISSPVRKSV
jgi:redox-sensitive bicupin YhaK (pirin superfamily)